MVASSAVSSDSDLAFVMTCLKHSGEFPKPNFEEVAKETGAKSANSCYHRFWQIKQKWGLTGSSKPAAAAIAAGTVSASNNSSPKTPGSAKRGRKASSTSTPNGTGTGKEVKKNGKAKKETSKVEGEDDGDDEGGVTEIDQEVKNEEDEDDEILDESPSKKVKVKKEVGLKVKAENGVLEG